VRGIEDARDTALRALEEEQRERARLREQEDRDTEDARDTQIRAIEDRRDAALNAIEDELDAEQRRHETVIDNLDRELAARLGEVDARIRAINDAEKKERQADTDRRLQQGLRDARGDLRRARREDDPRAIERAKRAVADAERAIEREQTQRRRDAARQQLEDQKQAIRLEIQSRRDAEQQQTQATREGLQDRQEATRTATDAELVQIRRRYEEEDRLRQDNRRAEDEAHQARVEQARTAAQQQIEAIKQVYDAPGGVIDTIRAQAEAADRAYAEQRQAIQDNARDAQLAARQTADAQIRELDRTTDNQVSELNQQMRNWRVWSENVIEQIKAVMQSYDQLNRVIRGQSSAPPTVSPGLRNPVQDEPIPRPSGTPGAAVPGSGAISQQSGIQLPGPEDMDLYLRSRGLQPGTRDYNSTWATLYDWIRSGGQPPDDMRITGRQHGGFLSRNMLAMVGEAGPELIRLDSRGGQVYNADRTRSMLSGMSGGSRAANITFNQTFQGVGYEVRAVIEQAVSESAELIADMLHEEVFSGPSPTRRSDPLGY
jgi:hypothetical protein